MLEPDEFDRTEADAAPAAAGTMPAPSPAPSRRATRAAPDIRGPSTPWREEQRRAIAHRLRCQAAGPAPDEGEVARLVAEFHARGGRVTLCPPAHALPVHNGAGREAARWVT